MQDAVDYEARIYADNLPELWKRIGIWIKQNPKYLMTDIRINPAAVEPTATIYFYEEMEWK